MIDGRGEEIITHKEIVRKMYHFDNRDGLTDCTDGGIIIKASSAVMSTIRTN